MSSTDQQLRQLANLERLRVLRSWALWLGIFLLFSVITVAGFGSVENPKNWTSAYSAMSQGGLLRWAVVPLIIVGVSMLVAGLSLHIIIAKGQR